MTDAILPQTPMDQLIRMLTKALETGRIVKIGAEADPIVLCHRSAGEEIDDPDCEDLFEATADGVFCRASAVTFRDGEMVRTGYRWLGYCSLDHSAMKQTFGPRIDALSHLDREGIVASTAWLIIQHQDYVAKMKRRAAALASRRERQATQQG